MGSRRLCGAIATLGRRRGIDEANEQEFKVFSKMVFSRILTQLDLTKQAIADNNHDNAEDFGKCLCDVYEEDFNLESEKDFTPEVARIQFDVLKTILDIHIMRGDPLDISIRAGQLWKRYKETREHFPQWADKDWEPIDDIIYRSYLAQMNFTIEKP